MSLPYIKDSSIHRPLQPGECLSEWATKTMLHGTSRSPGVATGVPIPSPSTPSSQLTQVITTPYSTDHLDLDDATLARNAGLDLATLDRSALRRLRNKISAARCRARKRMYQEKVARTEEGLRRLAGEVEAHVVELEGERAALMGRFMDRGLADLGESVGSSTQ